MNAYISAAMSRKRSGLAAFDQVLPAARLADSFRASDRRPEASRSGGVAACLATFVLGSVAQGAPFVLVAAELERTAVGAGWLATVAAVRLAPTLLFSPVAGAFAGRFEARTVFAAAGLGRGAVIVALWSALRVGAPTSMLVALLFALVAVGTPTFPALMRAMQHNVPAARLDRTSALAAGLESAAFCAGPALGGLLLLTAGIDSLLMCAAMMALSVGFASSFPGGSGAAWRTGKSPSRPIRSSGQCLLHTGIRPAIVAVLSVNVLAGLSATLLARLPDGLDLGGERCFGVLSVVQGLGAFGAFVVLISPISRGRRPLVPLAAAAASVGMLAATSELSVAVVACCVLGASILTAEVQVTSALGRSLPGRLVAPAFGVLEALMVAAMIAGAVVAPLLTTSFGLRPTLAIAAMSTPLLATFSLIGARR